MFLMVKAKVNTDKAMITSVRRSPQQLEFYGSAFSMGLAPNTSKNLIPSEK
jgi:hypothetical protein